MLPPRLPLQPTDQSDEPLIDLDTFSQILDLDEDDTHDFSKGMAFAFFSQAETTFDDMDIALCVFQLPFAILTLIPFQHRQEPLKALLSWPLPQRLLCRLGPKQSPALVRAHSTLRPAQGRGAES